MLPLICIGDESCFFQQAQQELQRIIEPALSKVVLIGDLKEVCDKADALFESDFYNKIAPLRIWEGQPIWCAWFIGSEKEYKSYLEARGRLQAHPYRAYRHFVFMKVSAWPNTSVEQQVQASNSEQLIFVLSEKGALTRTENMLAQAAAAYLYGGWMRFCKDGTGDLRDALSLHGREMVFTLGMAKYSPDYEYFRPMWTERLINAVKLEWLQKSASGDQVPFPTREALLKDLLPTDTYQIKQTLKPVAPAISFPKFEETYGFKYLENLQTPGFSAKNSFWAWPKRIALLRKLDEFLRLIILRTIQTIIVVRVKRFADDFEEQFKKFLYVKQDSFGLFSDLRSRIRLSQEYLEETRAAEILEPVGVCSVEENIAVVKRKVLAIPSIVSALLRLLLVSVGLVWMLFGSFIWGKGVNPFNDVLMRGVAILSASALAVFFVAVIARWYLKRQGAFKAESLARADIIQTHLVDIGRSIVCELKSGTSKLLMQVVDAGNKLDDLVDFFKKDSPKVELAKRVNDSPRFNDQAFQHLFRQKEKDLVLKVHSLIKEELEKIGWPNFSKERWCDVLSAEATRCICEALESLTYMQCVRAADLSMSDQARIVHDLINQARKPALPVSEEFASKVWLLAEPDCEKHLSSNDMAEVRIARIGDLIAVSPIPVVMTDMGMMRPS